jgi:hypothetical protein
MGVRLARSDSDGDPALDRMRVPAIHADTGMFARSRRQVTCNGRPR